MLVGATNVFPQHKLVRCREETLLASVRDLLGMKKNMNGKAPAISRGLLAMTVKDDLFSTIPYLLTLGSNISQE